MGDLPEVPFEKVLSYLSLSELIKSRAVSRLWCDRIDNFRVRSLCYSDRPRGFIRDKSRWVSGAFDQNFISSTRFTSFFNTFGSTILSGLKRLRLCDVRLSEDGTALIETINSFDQLKTLDIIRFNCSSAADPEGQFQLNLPMLNSIQLEEVYGTGQLTVNAPRLKEVRLEKCPKVSFVHVESVEKLIASKSTQTAIEQLKNLKYLHVKNPSATSLSDLDQLKEYHLGFRDTLDELFEQKRQHARADLKIYLCGCLLSGPGDSPELSPYDYYSNFLHLAANPSKLADEIRVQDFLHYPAIERVTPELATNIFKRFIDLKLLMVNEAVQDVQRFLNFLKSFNIVELQFYGDHPQELFDRLPEYATAVQWMVIESQVSNLDFLSGLKNLIHLHLLFSIDAESFIPDDLMPLFELEFLSLFQFKNNDRQLRIEWDCQRRVRLSVNGQYTFTDLNTGLQYLMVPPQLFEQQLPEQQPPEQQPNEQ